MMARVRRHGGAVGYYLGVLIAAAVLAWAVVRVVDLEQRVDSAEFASDEREVEVAVLAGIVDELRAQVLALGEEPVAPPPEDVVEDIPDSGVPQQGEPGQPGRPPTVSEIRAAVADVLAADPGLTRPQIIQAITDYLVANPPTPGQDGTDGTDGEPGEAGRPPTAEEIAVAVATYCADDACTGPPGATGPGPTDEQVASAVAAYCDARGECRGAPGLNGADGKDGAKGDKGDPGEPPLSWTQPGVLPGTTETCTRTDPFDPSAPTYQCA